MLDAGLPVEHALSEWYSWKQHPCSHDLELTLDLLHMFINALLGDPEDILSRPVYEVLVCALLCRPSIELVRPQAIAGLPPARHQAAGADSIEVRQDVLGSLRCTPKVAAWLCLCWSVLASSISHSAANCQDRMAVKGQLSP